MDVMKAVKNVLSGTIALVLIAMIFSPPQARADGMPGVRETPTEILVDIPPSCPVKFVWDIQWEETPQNKPLMITLAQADNSKIHRLLVKESGELKFETIWSGGRTVRIPKVDAKGKPIRITFLSILALGGGAKLQNKNNWAFIYSGGQVMTVSPYVARSCT